MTVTLAARESVSCNLCGADEVAVILEAQTGTAPPAYAASGDTPLQDRLVRCRRCGLVYVSPRPQQATIEEGYENVDNTVYLSQAPMRIATFRKALRWLESAGVPKGRVLDVGAAGGFFVKAAQDAGWSATGLEISRHLCDFGRSQLGVSMIQGTLQQTEFPDHSFDLITYWDVLEHVADPKDHLRRVHRLLKKDGHLLINYPDYDSVAARLLGRKWWFLIDVHIYYFTPASLAKLLRQCGFEPLRQRRHLQYLRLGYLLKRVEGSFPRIGRPLSRLCRLLHVEEIPIIYYGSQKTMLAKVSNVIQK